MRFRLTNTKEPARLIAKRLLAKRMLLIFGAWVCCVGESQADAAKATETQILQSHRSSLYWITDKYVPQNATGLIGRNHSWGKLYSPRLQMGAGRTTRIALAANDKHRAERSWRAVLAATKAITATGKVRSRVPLRYGWLKKIDKLSAASFYLGDACVALVAIHKNAIHQSDIDHSALASRDLVATKTRNNRDQIAKLHAAAIWLSKQSSMLMAYDKNAPNRQLFNARAFFACGQAFHDDALSALGRQFVQAALSNMTPAGYFREGGAWDTSYQAVALNVGFDLLLAGLHNEDLKHTLIQGAKWLGDRIDAEGRLDSTGNTRTCAQAERFLGKPKQVALDEVYMAMLYTGILLEQPALTAKANQLMGLYRNHSGDFDPCFSQYFGQIQQNPKI